MRSCRSCPTADHLLVVVTVGHGCRRRRAHHRRAVSVVVVLLLLVMQLLLLLLLVAMRWRDERRLRDVHVMVMKMADMIVSMMDMCLLLLLLLLLRGCDAQWTVQRATRVQRAEIH